MGSILKRIGKMVITIAILLAGWEYLVNFLDTPTWFLPPPSLIVESFIAHSGTIIKHFLVTAEESVIGFGIGAGLGIVLAVVIVHSRYLRETLYPLVVFQQGIPKVTLAPLFLVWFGYGMLPKIVIAFLISFFPVLLNMMAGLTEVKPSLIRYMDSLKASRFQKFLKVRLPNSITYLFPGLRTAATLSVIGAVVGEFVAADQGLGYQILIATAELKTAYMFALFVALGILSLILVGAIYLLERFVIYWPRGE